MPLKTCRTVQPSDEMKFTDLPTSIREFSVIETPPSGAQKEKGGNKPKSKIKAEISKIKSRKTVGKKKSMKQAFWGDP